MSPIHFALLHSVFLFLPHPTQNILHYGDTGLGVWQWTHHSEFQAYPQLMCVCRFCSQIKIFTSTKDKSLGMWKKNARTPYGLGPMVSCGSHHPTTILMTTIWVATETSLWMPSSKKWIQDLSLGEQEPELSQNPRLEPQETNHTCSYRLIYIYIYMFFLSSGPWETARHCS
jgi:hypothetical protein